MQSMVNRWKDKLSSIQEKQTITNLPYPPKPELTAALPEQQLKEAGLSMKKSLEKSKKSLHSHEDKMHSSKRLTTPSKHKQKSSKSLLIQKSSEAIFEIFAKVSVSDKTISAKIKNVLQQLWSKCQENLEKTLTYSNVDGVRDLETSIMRQSTISTSAAKRQERLYQDLEKKYFECEKEKHFLKNRIEEMIKKYENVQKELQHYSKIEKLVDNCLEREEATNQENKRLKQEVQLANLREVEQQKIFQSEINIVRELIESIKKHLPAR